MLIEGEAIRSRMWRNPAIDTGLSLAEEISRGAKANPDVRLTFSGADGSVTETTLAAADRDGGRVAAALEATGLRKGDVVAVQLPVCHEHLLIMIAAFRLGLIFLPLLHSHRAAELHFMLQQSRAKLLFMPVRWRNIDYAEKVSALHDLPDLKEVVWLGRDVPQTAMSWDGLLGRAAEGAVVPAVGPGDQAILLYTSGTTAEAKGALHSHETIAAEVRSIGHHFLPDPVPPALSCSVGGHIGAILTMMRPFLLGNRTVFLDHWDGDNAVRLIAEHELVFSNGAPFFLNSLLESMPPAGLPRFNYFSAGGASVPPALVERAAKAGITATRSYGSTEHPTISSGVRADPLARRAGTDGRLLPGVRVRIIDDAGQDMPNGTAGEVVSGGADLFLGYTNPAINREAFTPDGWFRTGDIGIMDDEGFLTIIDRKKDVIIRGGENVSSREVEDILCTIPVVLEAAAVPAPDPLMGERISVFVKLQPQSSLSLEEIQRHFWTAGVAKQKTPERLVIVEDFPRNLAGKVLKTELRKYWLT